MPVSCTRSAWIFAAALLTLGYAKGAAQNSAPQPAEATVTEAQAERGATAFRQNCLNCHIARQFAGPAFERARSGQPLFEFFDQIRSTMPQDEPGRLTRQQYADIVAYILKENTYATGKTEIAPTDDALKKLRFRKVQ